MLDRRGPELGAELRNVIFARRSGEIAFSLCLTCLRNKSRMFPNFGKPQIHNPVGPLGLLNEKK